MKNAHNIMGGLVLDSHPFTFQVHIIPVGVTGSLRPVSGMWVKAGQTLDESGVQIYPDITSIDTKSVFLSNQYYIGGADFFNWHLFAGCRTPRSCVGTYQADRHCYPAPS